MHAESLSRRSFKYYLIKRIEQDLDTFKDELDQTEFHLVISQLPCGLLKKYKGLGKI